MKVILELTEEEAKAVSTVLLSLNGNLQSHLMQETYCRENDSAADDAWIFWNNITQKINKAMGVVWSVPTLFTNELLGVNQI